MPAMEAKQIVSESQWFTKDEAESLGSRTRDGLVASQRLVEAVEKKASFPTDKLEFGALRGTWDHVRQNEQELTRLIADQFAGQSKTQSGSFVQDEIDRSKMDLASSYQQLGLENATGPVAAKELVERTTKNIAKQIEAVSGMQRNGLVLA